MKHMLNNHVFIKLIVVNEQKNGLLPSAVLKEIFDYCGYNVIGTKKELIDSKKVDYVILSADEYKEVPPNLSPTILLLSDYTDLDRDILNEAKNFACCVIDYDFTVPKLEESLTHCRILSYSTNNDNADFTARNIHYVSKESVAFEIVGVGVIGRVKLMNANIESVMPILVAASAAIACGIPFADVLDALNNMVIAV